MPRSAALVQKEEQPSSSLSGWLRDPSALGPRLDGNAIALDRGGGITEDCVTLAPPEEAGRKLSMPFGLLAEKTAAQAFAGHEATAQILKVTSVHTGFG